VAKAPRGFIKRHCFPVEFQKALISRETDQTNLARAMTKRGYRISKQFMSFMANGDRRVPAEQLRRMCEVLQLDEVERLKLHKAAAIDYGFELGAING
jgi:hypothetical protein